MCINMNLVRQRYWNLKVIWLFIYSILFKAGYKSYSERKQNGMWKYLAIEMIFFGYEVRLFVGWLFFCLDFLFHVDQNQYLSLWF